MQPDFWNERYGSEEYIYGTAPNAWFAANLKGRMPGKLLLPCEGEGRNAVFAAGLGWQVRAFDQSTAGREKALKLAGERKVSIDYLISDVLDFEGKEGEYDMIAFIFAHFPPDIRPLIHKKAVMWLKPGGMLLLEAFSKAQVAFSSGGPRDPGLLYETRLLENDFAGLQTLVLEEASIQIDEGSFHRGEARVIRYLGRRI